MLMANEVLNPVKAGDRINHRAGDSYRWFVQDGVVSFPDWRAILGGPLRVSLPAPLTEAQPTEFAARERLLEAQRLPGPHLYAAYQLLSPAEP